MFWNKFFYPVELVSAKHEKLINKDRSEIMFPGRIFFKILSKNSVDVYLSQLKANEYNKADCYIHPKGRYGYAISNDMLITLFLTKDKYINGVIKSAISNGVEYFLYNISISNEHKNEMIFDKLIRRGLKPRYE